MVGVLLHLHKVVNRLEDDELVIVLVHARQKV